jgi:hypothetical protein
MWITAVTDSPYETFWGEIRNRETDYTFYPRTYVTVVSILSTETHERLLSIINGSYSSSTTSGNYHSFMLDGIGNGYLTSVDTQYMLQYGGSPSLEVTMTFFISSTSNAPFTVQNETQAPTKVQLQEKVERRFSRILIED